MMVLHLCQQCDAGHEGEGLAEVAEFEGAGDGVAIGLERPIGMGGEQSGSGFIV